MIVLLTTRTHRRTHEPLRRDGRFDFRVRTYRSVFRSRRLRLGTYVFTDLDRLDFWELELAARVYRQLSMAGARVLNDPARVRHRFSLLRTLHDEGLNHFDVWRVEDTRRPRRFPVFLRSEAAHRGPISDLLHDETQVREAVEDALSRGIPMRGLLLVEYRAEPVRKGLFRKLGMYRVGDRLVPALCAHDTRWSPKRGKTGAADQELYEDEHRMITEDRHVDALWPAFRVANIEYGRADFGLVDGQPEVYEINTNPFVRRLTSHPFPIRVRSEKLAFQKLTDAFEAIDVAAGSRVKLEDIHLRRQKLLDLWIMRPRWIP